MGNGQGLGGQGFSGSIGQPGAVGMGPGNMGGGGPGNLNYANRMLFSLLGMHPELFGMPKGTGVPMEFINRAVGQIQTDMAPAPNSGALFPNATPAPAQGALMPKYLPPQAVKSPYQGLGALMQRFQR